jgi:hypothetical protein
MSRNPFLSTFEAEFNKEAKKTDLIDMSAPDMRDSPKKATFGATEELFVRPPAAARVVAASTLHTQLCPHHRKQNPLHSPSHTPWSASGTLSASLLTILPCHRRTSLLRRNKRTGGAPPRHDQYQTAALPTRAATLAAHTAPRAQTRRSETGSEAHPAAHHDRLARQALVHRAPAAESASAERTHARDATPSPR